MIAALTDTGLEIETFDDALDDVVAALATALKLTPGQAQRVRSDVRSTLGNLARIDAERDVIAGELLLEVYDTLSLHTHGANLDRVVALLGIERRPAVASEVLGVLTGETSHVATAGTTLRYEPDGSIWELVEDVDLGGSGEASGVRLRAQDVAQPREPNLGPDHAATVNGPLTDGVYRLTVDGYGLGAPVEVDVTRSAGQPALPGGIAAALELAIQAEKDLDGIVTMTRRVGSVLEIWADPTLPAGTIAGTVIAINATASITVEPLQAWTVLDDPDVHAFSPVEQPIVGTTIESDASLRDRARVEAYRRGQGPLAAMEAAVSAVDGVTFVRAWENTGDPAGVDADGIPGRSINVVVQGGSNADVVEAILASRPAGIYLHGTDVVEVVDLGLGRTVTVRFDRVADVPIWIRATAELTGEAPANALDAIEAALLSGAESLFGIGDDVRPWKLYGSIKNAGIPGIDDLAIEVSDDGNTWQTANYDITIRERATFDAARIEATL